MNRSGSVAAVVAMILGMATASSSQEEPKPAPPGPAAPAQDAAKERKQAKVRRYIEVSRWEDRVIDGLAVVFAASEKMRQLPRGYADRFRETCDREALRAAGADALGEMLEEADLDAAIAFHESPAGKRVAEALPRAAVRAESTLMKWMVKASSDTVESLMDKPAPPKPGAAAEDDDPFGMLGNLKKAKMSANETAAIATLRNLCSCQAQIQTSGKIDCDNDGIGEYGTFLEMTGSTGVRNGRSEGSPSASDFSEQGSKVKPPILSPALAAVDGEGIVRKSGYCFRLYLPDTAKPAGFVHETGPRDKPALAGGSGKIATDLAETNWCAYAWPVKPGDTGTRVFFTNHAGDVLQSANEKNKWGGDKAPPPDAALLGAGMTGEPAIGTLGRDGEVWQVTN